MFDLLRKSFGLGAEVDFAALVKQGAKILDVRTPEEFRDGHISGSKNIPVQVLPTRLADIPRGETIITCCASGVRSATAKRILEAAGYTPVHNGGGWRGLKAKL